MKKGLFEWLVAIVIGVVISLVITQFVASVYKVSGLSMYPTFNDQDRVIVSKISNQLNQIDHGDVIVFHKDANTNYIKRVIGKPGDHIVYKHDQLYVNGKRIEEPYLEENKSHKVGKTLTENFSTRSLVGSNGQDNIPKDKYLVLGDNRQNSIDSRSTELGLISKQQVVGKVIIRFWPFNQFTTNFNT
ncbi:signal peptidase I [Staphylococcus muscae]|uniref:Signal peptidase I n=1 Tax=Staphylococcus muscae TaxID=1294 RepID=A0A240BX01_9STAP|nr:signal peptidase I [Staphylococcus muscae]AVQ34320.1 signal peptidase I [Staphylococcus muscae]PNZ02934.1 signal peptidase I [Staphylococcus muscae]GGA84213.1 signal peptidase I [Staphylococcus muscae]SNW00244.1 type-I signal peptidase SipB [Staphylococcus muscae]